MRVTSFLLGALAYVLVTFPLAFVWHLVIKEATHGVR
jgi:hypothetical protein